MAGRGPPTVTLRPSPGRLPRDGSQGKPGPPTAGPRGKWPGSCCNNSQTEVAVQLPKKQDSGRLVLEGFNGACAKEFELLDLPQDESVLRAIERQGQELRAVVRECAAELQQAHEAQLQRSEASLRRWLWEELPSSRRGGLDKELAQKVEVGLAEAPASRGVSLPDARTFEVGQLPDALTCEVMQERAAEGGASSKASPQAAERVPATLEPTPQQSTQASSSPHAFTQEASSPKVRKKFLNLGILDRDIHMNANDLKARVGRVLHHTGTAHKLHDAGVRTMHSVLDWSHEKKVWYEKKLDLAMSVIIVVSAMIMIAKMQWQGYLCHVSLGQDEPGTKWHGAELAFDIAEYVLTSIFLMELIFRLWVRKLKLFKSAADVIDCTVVVLTALDTLVLSFVFAGGFGGAGIIVGRLVRIAKLTKTLRIVRTLNSCHELRVVTRTISASMGSLFWSMVILGCLELMAAIFLCEGLQPFIREAENDPKTRQWVMDNYGDALKSLWTLYKITFSGGWPQWVQPLVDDVSPSWGVFFFVYVSGVVFAIVRIITALFLKDTLDVAAHDVAAMKHRSLAEKARATRKLEKLWEEGGFGHDALLSWEDFNFVLSGPHAQEVMMSLELDWEEVHSVFFLLDDGDGKVSFDEFLSGVLRMKGQPRSGDVLALLHDTKKILSALDHLSHLSKPPID